MIRADDSLFIVSSLSRLWQHLLPFSPSRGPGEAGCSRVGQQGGWTLTNHSFLSHATQHLLITAKDKSASAGRTHQPGARGPQPGLISGQICLFRTITNIWILKIRASEKRRVDFTALKRRGREDIGVSQKQGGDVEESLLNHVENSVR